MIGAIISGEGRVAVFLEGAEVWCVYPDSRTPQRISHGQLPHVFGGLAAGERYPDATLERTQELLQKSCAAERGLQLALILLDSESSDATCNLAEDALEDFLEDAYVSEFIRNRLSTKRLPAGTRWTADSPDTPFPRVSLLRNWLIASQPAIGLVRAAWDALPDALFGDTEERSQFESVLAETGAFQALARVAADTTGNFSKGEAQYRILSERRYQVFANWRNILLEWARAIPTTSRRYQQQLSEEPAERGRRFTHKVAGQVAPYQAFQNVIVQKEAIIEQLARKKFPKAELFVADLLKRQLSDGNPDLAAKSLCDLAKEAKDRGLLHYQLEWSLRAKEIFPSDPFVHAQFADALLGQGRLQDALIAYESTVQEFPQHVAARTGQAEALKALGRLPEALAAYESTVRDFPENIVARNGQAELLKALGRLPEALAIYESTVLEFPQDVVPRSGRAELLKALGRLPEALAAYESTVQEFPQHVPARTGQAEVLKALGRLPEALTAYDLAVRDFPQNVVARTGQAEVLKALGRLPEALAAYESTVQDFPQDVVPRSGRAEALKALGRLPEALAAYESTVQDFPQEVVPRNGLAGVLKALGRLEEALVAYISTVQGFPQNVVARCGQAEVLKALGRLPEALAVYESTVQDFPQDVVPRSGRAEVLKALGQLEEALAAYESAVQDFPQDVVARTGRAEVLKALGRLTEALAAYQSTVQDFPQSVVARHGQATLLVHMGRYVEAENLVQTERIKTRDEWIGLHILASIKMKQGKFAEADRLFSRGTDSQWIDVRSRFIGTRALLRMRTNRLREAQALLRSDSSLTSKVIQIDIYRRMKRINEARSVLNEIRDCSIAEIRVLSQDLDQNMKPGKRTVTDDEFLDRELALLLAA